MKLWLDDRRPAPEGWTLCRWPEDVISLLKTQNVEEISLDHDLDDYLCVGQGYCCSSKERTGYDVLLWIEEQVITNNYVPPKINIHTANPSAREKMLKAVESIKRNEAQEA